MPKSVACYAVAMSETTIPRRAVAHRGRRLEYFTIAWNTFEGLIGVGAGLLAGSISLVGFGMDSFIEVTSGATLLWRMSVDEDIERRTKRETEPQNCRGLLHRARHIHCLRSNTGLDQKKAPAHSIPGIVLACVSLVVMPILSRC
jgi:hypothetical protein